MEGALVWLKADHWMSRIQLRIPANMIIDVERAWQSNYSITRPCRNLHAFGCKLLIGKGPLSKTAFANSYKIAPTLKAFRACLAASPGAFLPKLILPNSGPVLIPETVIRGLRKSHHRPWSNKDRRTAAGKKVAENKCEKVRPNLEDVSWIGLCVFFCWKKKKPTSKYSFQ